MEFDKVEVWKCDGGYRLHICINDATYGIIMLCSDIFRGIWEADSRAFVLSRALNLSRDKLPVHSSASPAGHIMTEAELAEAGETGD